MVGNSILVRAVLLSALALWACSSEGPAPTPIEPPIPAIPPTAVDSDRLISMIEDLSADDMKGRLTGSPSGALAEAYVIEHLQALGLEVATQDVSLPVFDVGSPIDLSVVDGQGQTLHSFEYISAYREVMFGGSGAVTGDLEFAGNGSASDYDGLDVSGLVVAVLSGPGYPAAFNEKIFLAHEKGAVGVIFIPTGDVATVDAMQDGVPSTRLSKSSLSRRLPRIPSRSWMSPLFAGATSARFTSTTCRS